MSIWTKWIDIGKYVKSQRANRGCLMSSCLPWIILLAIGFGYCFARVVQ